MASSDCELKSDNVMAVQKQGLHHKVPQLSIKECDAPAVATWHIRCHHMKPRKLPCLNASDGLGFLYYSQIYVILVHPAYFQLEATIATISYVVVSKTYHLLLFVWPPPIRICLVETPVLQHIPYQWCGVFAPHPTVLLSIPIHPPPTGPLSLTRQPFQYGSTHWMMFYSHLLTPNPFASSPVTMQRCANLGR